MQPPTEALSVSRRPLDLEDYVDIVRRHKAWILGPLFGSLVVGVVVAFLWPDTYVSSALIKVVPQQVPEQFVSSNVTTEMTTRINAMAQNIVSRAHLTNLITTFSLYPRERTRMPLEDIMDQMKKDIKITPVVALTQGGGRQNVPAFSVQFSYENRALAQRVVQELASSFINQNLDERTRASELTTNFLNDELEKARKDVQQLDAKLAEFRLKNAGRLPEQVQVAMQQLNAYDNRISTLQAQFSRSGQDKMVLESQKRILESQLRSLTPPQDQVQMAAKSEKMAEMERQVEQAETQLAALRERYRDSYPEVQRAQQIIRVLKAKRDEVMKEEQSLASSAKSDKPARPVSPGFVREQRDYEANIQRLQAAMNVKDQEMEDVRKEIASTTAAQKALQAKVDTAPLSDQAYSELVRDRDMLRQRYEDLLRRSTQSKLGTELEKRAQGERLELLDPATLPQTPTDPKRPVIIAIACGIGLAIGIFMAGAREVRDTSLKNLKDVRAYTQLNVLGVAPLLENDLVVRRRRRLAYLAWSTAILVGCVVMAGSVFYYFNFRA